MTEQTTTERRIEEIQKEMRTYNIDISRKAASGIYAIFLGLPRNSEEDREYMNRHHNDIRYAILSAFREGYREKTEIELKRVKSKLEKISGKK